MIYLCVNNVKKKNKKKQKKNSVQRCREVCHFYNMICFLYKVIYITRIYVFLIYLKISLTTFFVNSKSCHNKKEKFVVKQRMFWIFIQKIKQDISFFY